MLSELRNEPRGADAVDRQSVFIAVHVYQNVAVPVAHEYAPDMLAALDRESEPDLHIRTPVAMEVIRLKERTIQTGRRHFKVISAKDRIFHVQNATYLITDSLAVIDADSVFGIDVNTKQGAAWRRVALHSQQLVAKFVHCRLNHGFYIACSFVHRSYKA